jgi:hypothetical protein
MSLFQLSCLSVESLLSEARKLTMPAHHDVRAKDVNLKRLGAVLAVAHEQELRDFASLLLVEGLGPRTLQSLALVAEVAAELSSMTIALRSTMLAPFSDLYSRDTFSVDLQDG